jgi:5-amino-6-(5-phosphoribosylamino)uracil reductase
VPVVVVSRHGGEGLDTSRLPSSTLVLTGAAGAARSDGSFECVVAGDDEVDLSAGLELLAARGLRRLVCEGGPMLFSSLLDRGLVDELCLTVSPLLVGGAQHLMRAPADPPRPLRLLSLLQDGNVLLGRWAVDAPSG